MIIKKQEYLETGPKKHNTGKNIWSKWVQKFETFGLDNVRLNNEFKNDFTLDFYLVYSLLQKEGLLKTIPETRIITKEDSFLCFLHECKTGARIVDLSLKFGGKKSFHDKLFKSMIDRLVYYFASLCKIPSREEAEYHTMLLKR